MKKSYTKIPNDLLRQGNKKKKYALNDSEILVLIYILSCKDDFPITVSRVSTEMAKDYRTVKKSMENLLNNQHVKKLINNKRINMPKKDKKRGVEKKEAELVTKHTPENKKDVKNTVKVTIIKEDRFDEFWNAYDYKKSRLGTKKAWNKLSKADKDKAMEYIPYYKQDCADNNRNRQYPATYLNKRTFEDEMGLKGNAKSYDNIKDIF